MDLADTPRQRRRAGALDAVLTRAAALPDTTPRYATGARWRLLAAAGLLAADATGLSTVDAAVAEAVGATLPDSPYQDALLAADLLTAAGAQNEAAQVRAGTTGAAVAFDERLGVTPGSNTGTLRHAANLPTGTNEATQTRAGTTGAVAPDHRHGATPGTTTSTIGQEHHTDPPAGTDTPGKTTRTGAIAALSQQPGTTPGSTVTHELTGTLRHVHHADRADLLVVVVPGPGGGAAVAAVPVDAGGVIVTGGPAAQVSFAAVGVEPRPLAAEAWSRSLAAARVRLAAHLVGVAEAAVVVAEQHTVRRRQFGAPLATFQGVSFPLASAAARTEGVRMLAHYTASVVHRPLAPHVVERMAAQALAAAARVARSATAIAVHAHGSVGLTERAPVAGMHLHARAHGARLGTTRALDRLAGAAIAADDNVPHRFYGEGD